jgi:GMP synthase (glutamine-hydrolysing)
LHRPFLLLQARNLGDAMLAHEVNCFSTAMGLADGELVAINVCERLPTPTELRSCAAILIGGSGDYSVLDDDGWIRAFVNWVREEIVLSGKPTFASCFGFQILVLAIGGRMIRDPRNMELGTFGLALTPAAVDDPLFKALPQVFDAQVGHKDRATVLPDGVHALAGSALCPLHAFRVGHLPIWATQFHPELNELTMADRFRRYRAAYGPPGPDTDTSADEAFLGALRPTDEASLLLGLFTRWVVDFEAALDSPRR